MSKGNKRNHSNLVLLLTVLHQHDVTLYGSQGEQTGGKKAEKEERNFFEGAHSTGTNPLPIYSGIIERKRGGTSQKKKRRARRKRQLSKEVGRYELQQKLLVWAERAKTKGFPTKLVNFLEFKEPRRCSYR